MDHPESFKRCKRIFCTLKNIAKIPLFGISRLQTGSYFWYQTAIKTKPLTFLHFNCMVKECARPKKSNFKLSFFSVNPTLIATIQCGVELSSHLCRRLGAQRLWFFLHGKTKRLVHVQSLVSRSMYSVMPLTLRSYATHKN